MKKATKKFLGTCLLIMIGLLLIGVLIINKSSIGDTSFMNGKLRSRDNNTISFNSSFLKDYVYITLKSSDSENIEAGLKFDIINSKGEKVDSGTLYDGKAFYEVYDGMAGEWKIILHFEDDNDRSMIAFRYSSTSKKKKTTGEI